MLTRCTALVPVLDGNFPQCSGLRFTIHSKSHQVSNIEVLQENGSYVPLDLNHIYSVALTNYNHEGGGFFAFVKKYPFFMVFLLGAACCFFAHNMINDFMIQIIRSLGGNETQLGYATFLQAILELPVMALIGFVLKKISERHMLVFSAVSFFIKTAILIFATSMFGMYVSQSFQMFAYAVFIPTAAYFADHMMKENDKVKGQAFINSSITLGGVFSNLVCGKILDAFGVKVMLGVGVSVCLVGVAIVMIAVYPMMKKIPKTAE